MTPKELRSQYGLIAYLPSFRLLLAQLADKQAQIDEVKAELKESRAVEAELRDRLLQRNGVTPLQKPDIPAFTLKPEESLHEKLVREAEIVEENKLKFLSEYEQSQLLSQARSILS